MKKIMFAVMSVAAVSFALVGCGSSSSQGPGPHHGEGPHGDHHGPPGEGHHHEHGGHHGDGHHHPPDLKGAMKGFHDVLAPVYHMDKGPARNDKACGAAAQMKEGAGKVAAEPAGDPAIWKAKSDALAQNVDALDKACKADGKPEVAAKLELVHDAFHALMGAQKKAN